MKDDAQEITRLRQACKSGLRLGYGERCDGDDPDRIYLLIKVSGQPDDAPARHWCFKAAQSSGSRCFWEAGMANGGTDNGPPGIRDIYHASYYVAFLIDPSGNRVEEWQRSDTRRPANPAVPWSAQGHNKPLAR
jgi:hypothetical protein